MLSHKTQDAIWDHDYFIRPLRLFGRCEDLSELITIVNKVATYNGLKLKISFYHGEIWISRT